MDCHEGGEPEAGGGYPAYERMGLGRGLAVGAGRGRLEAMLFGQPAEPEAGELGGQFTLEVPRWNLALDSALTSSGAIALLGRRIQLQIRCGLIIGNFRCQLFRPLATL